MTDSVQTGIMTILAAITTGMLSWAASTLAAIRKDINHKVDKIDCGHNMDGHCKRLDQLEQDLRKNTTDIAVLNERLK